MRKIVFILLGMIGVLAVLGVAFGPRALERWSQPLGPSLDLPTLTPTASAVPTEAPLAAVQITSTLGPAVSPIHPTRTPRPTVTPEPLCGGPAVMTILGVGADSRGNDYLYGLGDVIRIIRVDFVTPKVTVISIPRDLWVEIPGIEDHYGITHGKLNQAYLYGGPGFGYYDGPGGGPGLLARTLDQNFGLRVDHYGAVNMTTFERIVDAVGGIDIYLPEDVDGRPIDDRTEDMGYFYAGQHHFNGNQALRFSRIRKKYNDFTRMSNQNMVLCSLREKVLSPAVLPKVPQIIASFENSVLTDLSPAQLGQLACLGPQVSSENLIFGGIPDEILEPAREYSPQLKDTTFVYHADFDVIRDIIQDFQAGIWPVASEENSSCPEFSPELTGE